MDLKPYEENPQKIRIYKAYGGYGIQKYRIKQDPLKIRKLNSDITWNSFYKVSESLSHSHYIGIQL